MKRKLGEGIVGERGRVRDGGLCVHVWARGGEKWYACAHRAFSCPDRLRPQCREHVYRQGTLS